ncbi:DMT family transporter [Novosphingobium sp. 9]|uniref:DMT family transporter n=1 Tax=Novosphingobium sp. 9 TaxID=2025349 RepID=UPI0021B61B98|nr:DMT family transporter [Novosphingobium sp. 9]
MTASATPAIPPRTRTQDSPLAALGLRVLGMFMLSAMFMLIRLASRHGVSVPEMLFWRQGMAVPIMLLWLAARGEMSLLKTHRVPAHLGRAAVGTLGLLCNVGTATLLPLPVGTTLSFTSPIFAVLIAGLVLREKVGPWRWSAVLIGFAGVLLIARPGAEPIALAGLASGLGAGLIVATVSFQVRSLARTDSPIACVFWFSAFGAVVAAIALPLYGQPHPWQVWLMLVGVGLAGTLAQFFIAAALSRGAVATVVVMDYTSLIWATGFGVLVFGEWPPASIWLGAPLVIGAGLLITWREIVLAKAIAPTTSLDDAALEEAKAGPQPL